jgi:acyl-CoA reductase-like NAD-dependent aldehyde dehydrogenase
MGAHPLHQIAGKVAAALAAGCTVVLKPSEFAPTAGYELADILHIIGLPAGVFNLVCGAGPVTGEAIATHPGIDAVSFTESGAAGRRVGRGRGRVCLACGVSRRARRPPLRGRARLALCAYIWDLIMPASS